MSKKRSFKVTEDLENWMGKLPEDLKRIPFIHLAIPGEFYYYFFFLLNIRLCTIQFCIQTC